ncbi:hypothetical protein Dimus_004469 [Dionaea muscipula]
MSPPHLGVGEEGGSNVTSASATIVEAVLGRSLEIKEHNYMGLSDCSSSVGSSGISSASEETRSSLNLKSTELRLGLPGSQSPERDSEVSLLNSSKLDEKLLFPLHLFRDESSSSLHKCIVSGSKRGFSDVMTGFSESKFHANPELDAVSSPRSISLKETSAQAVKMKDLASPCAALNRAANDASSKHIAAVNHSSAPVTKAQVVGWPPIRSFRKNSLATTSKNTGEVEGKTGTGYGALFIKVSMDGAPYLRKVDLKAYSAYEELSSALETMFSCFTIGRYASHGTTGREKLSDSKLKDMLNGSEYVLTYEDKDGDWMLVGDVPWEMFIETCKRLRIMKSADAIGLAPRSVDKCRTRK